MVPLEEIFCFIDDFCKGFEKYSQGYFLANPARKRKRTCHMTIPEIGNHDNFGDLSMQPLQNF